MPTVVMDFSGEDSDKWVSAFVVEVVGKYFFVWTCVNQFQLACRNICFET